jgi:triacylglycerol lipase
MKRLRGFKDFVFETVEEITTLVEKTHVTTVRRTVTRVGRVVALEPPPDVVDALHKVGPAGVYATIRGVNRAIQTAVDVGGETLLGPAWHAEEEHPALATPLRSDVAGTLPWLLDHAQGALNGILGDRLFARGNGLDLKMSLRHHGRAVPPEREHLAQILPDATGKIALFIHGLCCTEWSWSLYADAHHGDPEVTYGSLLREDLGYTPLYIRYNTGRHVSDNGQALADLLEQIVEAFPVPVEEILLVGHSMGGLVARSAACYGTRRGATWASRLRHVFCLGSPHLGAPLEKATNALAGALRFLQSAGADVPADLLDMRSAGIKDLRFGYTVEEEWCDADPEGLEDGRLDIPLADGVGYYFVAATLRADLTDPWSNLLGDLLVQLPSAAGHHDEPARRIRFTSGAVFGGLHHFDIVNHPDVYDVIRRCLVAAPALPVLPHDGEDQPARSAS